MIINGTFFNCELEDVIDELTSQLAINQIPLLQTIKDSGNDIMVSCPYHKDGQERKPSAGIRKSDGKFHCFACGETHELPEVISYCFGHYDDLLGGFGWKWLNKNFATITVEERKGVEIDIKRPIITRENRMGNSQLDIHNSNEPVFVDGQELDSYRYIHPYMYRRKLTDEVIELFDIGYDKQTQCITFPVRDIDGNCLFIARRSVKFKYFNYPKGIEKPLYGLYELNQSHNRYDSDVIVCESMLDALTCWVYGRPAVALNGLGNERQFKELRELPYRKLILATDADEAGMKARNRIKRNVKNKLITQYIWDKDKAKDINDMDKEMFESLKEVF